MNGLGTSVANGREHLGPAILNLDKAIIGEEIRMSLSETSSNIFAAYRILGPTMFLHSEQSSEWRQIIMSLSNVYEALGKIETGHWGANLTSEQKDTLKQIRFFLTEVRESLDGSYTPSIRILIGSDPDFYIPPEAIQRAYQAATVIQEYLQSKQ